ncbi:MAG: Integrase core domain protein [Candidatus Methanoperedens nitroreducens]|uniref:Integrase core domain protein n=1 Tax=Candidatus Methanoperedens nitratireducens TaxID=1392998 RepID=A0A0P7ZM50_9EURY|nr:MAG: Integrase core domain protein [Candidatus Methanoperedens sp. BLZ1]
MHKKDIRQETALFRYGVIARLVSGRTAERDEVMVLREQILSTEWDYPDGTKKLVPERTLRHWLRRYRKHGFIGLHDEFRNDKGVSKAIPKDVMDRAERLRRENSKRSVRTIIKLLKAEGVDTSLVKERTLARQLVRRRATKKLLKKGLGSYQRWEQLYVNDMWQSDVSHGIWLRDPQNPSKSKLTKLIAFLDDASRVITHAEFYWNEQLPSLLDCYGKALLKRGRPCRLLLDNGSIYRSKTFAVMCAELGVELAFCRPRSPQGKGKIERFFLTAQQSFFNEAYKAGIESLSELNNLFEGWLKSEYHDCVHSELDGRTPVERWRKDIEHVSIVTPDELRRSVMMRESRTINMNTATVSVNAREYQASPDLAGQIVEVRWHPNHIASVELWMGGEFIEVADEFEVKPWVERRTGRQDEEEPVNGVPHESSRNYLHSLTVGNPDTGLIKTKGNELLTNEQFFDLFTHYLKRVFIAEELELIGRFFREFAPFRKSKIESTLGRAVEVKGNELHLRYYLEQLEASIRQGGN